MEFKSNIPIYLQVIKDIEKQIITGVLPLGSKLPSSRELALHYQINPNTAARIYNEMELKGISFTKRGIGTFVTEDPQIISAIKQSIVDELLDEFDSQLRGLGYTPKEALLLLENHYKRV